MIKRIFSGLLALTALALVASPCSAQEKIKVGYWTSGFSVGFGAVLEAGKFMQAQGLDPEFIKFSDVNGPTTALLTHSIDVAFAAPASGAFTLGVEKAPVEVILSTQVAEATFVAREGSPLNSLADLKGKKVGMSPVGSATYAIAASVLKNNYGLGPNDFTPIPGNEGRLVQFLQRGDVDAASLRAVTIASVPDLKLKKLGSMVDEWKKMAKSDTLPVLGVTIVHKDFAQAHPEAVVKFVRGMIAATKFGAAEEQKTSDILRQAANLDAKDATSYARLWNQIYQATFEPADVATLKKMAEIFLEAQLIEAQVPDTLFNPAPYQKAKRQ